MNDNFNVSTELTSLSYGREKYLDLTGARRAKTITTTSEQQEADVACTQRKREREKERETESHSDKRNLEKHRD